MSTGHKTALGLLLVACLATRLLALDADPPRWLSWSMGTQTDEGFYTLDARHEALFGAWAPGNFHDRLVSPLLSLLQQAIFHTIGVGTVQARLISVTFGLLTIFAFWYGLRAAYGDRVALWGAFLLGLSPPVVFYNRLALQETPTVFWLVLAFALWCAAGKQGIGRAHGATLALSGLCVAAALIFKALAIIALPAFLLVWYRSGGRAAFVGLTAALLLYGLLWYGPHHAELSRMAAYYRTHQFEPHSARSVWLNIRRGFVDTERGLAPYLLRLTPVPCLLALASLRRRAATPDIALATWLLGGLAFCLLSSYAPDRYYVLFFPAMTALAAVGAARLPRSWQLVGAGLFLVTSGYWYRSAWQGRGYARRDAARLLTRTLPAGSVLVGEMAPALGLDTPFRAAPVQPGLSNDDRPAERLGATHVLVTRAPRQTRWWRTHEPQAVQPSRRVLSLPLQDRQGDVVDVYAVGKGREPMTETNLKTGLRVVLAAGMVYAGIAHFRNPAPFVSIVPDWLPAHRALVAVSGAFEVAGGVGLLPPPTRRAAAWGLIALFVAVFPANVNMALRDIPLEGRHFPPWALWLRLPLQALLIAWAWWYTQKEVETPPTPNSPGDAREIA